MLTYNAISSHIPEVLLSFFPLLFFWTVLRAPCLPCAFMNVYDSDVISPKQVGLAFPCYLLAIRRATYQMISLIECRSMRVVHYTSYIL